MNLTVIRGRLSRPASIRELPSGTRLASLDVTTDPHRDGEPADTVPVVWRDPPASVESLDTDDDVVVVGRVRRRFFRAGGVTQSRTEVEAERGPPEPAAGPGPASRNRGRGESRGSAGLLSSEVRPSGGPGPN